VVVTLGAEGAAVCLPRRPPGCDVQRGGVAAGCDVMEVEAAPLMDGEKIVDTVGAGDAFVGAFCAALAAGACTRYLELALPLSAHLKLTLSPT